MLRCVARRHRNIIVPEVSGRRLLSESDSPFNNWHLYFGPQVPQRHRPRSPPFDAFHVIRSRYFSNAVVAVDDEQYDERYNAETHDSNATKELYDWFLRKHSLIGDKVGNAFQVNMVRIDAALSILESKHMDNPSFIAKQKELLSGFTQLWTAVFVDPITLQHYEAKEIFTDPNQTFILLDGKFYFTKKRDAIRAAAANFLYLQVGFVNDVKEEFEDETGSAMSSLKENPNLALFADSTTTPRSKLQAVYRQYRIFPTKEDVHIFKQNFVGNADRGGTWWTSCFQCPVTAQRFEAIELVDVPHDLKMKHGGRLWYRHKHFAVHASAANALESIDWQHIGRELSTSHLHEQSPLDGSFGVNTERSWSRVQDQKVKDFEYSVQPLSSWYYKEHGVDFSPSQMEENFVATEIGLPGQTMNWTASFLCPVTGQRFDSGSLNDFPFQVMDGTRWYGQKYVAMQAAALFAYDSLRYRKTGEVAPRFCREDPSVVIPVPLVITNHDGRSQSDENLADDTTQGKNGVKLLSIVKSSNTVEDQIENEDFVIEVIPQRINLCPCNRSSTLDVIAETWIELARARSRNGGQNEATMIDDMDRITKQRQEAIVRACGWLAEQTRGSEYQPVLENRTQFDSNDHSSGLAIANLLLASLGESHQLVPFASQPVGVERTAKSILDKMWSSNKYLPDANSYAHYLKCLEGETPEVVAERAREIVVLMETGHESDGRILPKPNSALYSSFLQLSSWAGIPSACVFSDQIQWTREMLLSELSSMAHHPERFKVDRAMEIIDRIKGASLDTEIIELDVNVFNASLRWSGGPLWTRHYSRSVPWDSYSDIYTGILPKDTSSGALHDQAREMEKWVYLLKSKGLSPNVETYESLIQAWTRCGTLSCLQKASKYAEEIINGEVPGVNPRLQTFYPILAGYTYAGCNAEAKIWLDQVQKIFPELAFQRRFVTVPFLSCLAKQKHLLTGDIKSIGQNVSSIDVRVAAEDCSRELGSLIDDYKALPDFFLPFDIFLLTAQAWYNVACKTQSEAETIRCIEDFEALLEVLEDFVEWLFKTQSKQSKSQLNDVLNLSPRLYGTHLKLLEKLGNNGKEREKANDLTKHLLVVEKTLRRSSEFIAYLDDLPLGSVETHPTMCNDHGDLSAFPSASLLQNPLCNTWAEYRSNALAVLEVIAVKSSVDRPVLARICHLFTQMAVSTVEIGQLKDWLNELGSKENIVDINMEIAHTQKMLQNKQRQVPKLTADPKVSIHEGSDSVPTTAKDTKIPPLSPGLPTTDETKFRMKRNRSRVNSPSRRPTRHGFGHALRRPKPHYAE